jgi:hypothetical protein
MEPELPSIPSEPMSFRSWPITTSPKRILQYYRRNQPFEIILRVATAGASVYIGSDSSTSTSSFQVVYGEPFRFTVPAGVGPVSSLGSIDPEELWAVSSAACTLHLLVPPLPPTVY